MLELRGFSVAFGGRQVFEKVSFGLAGNERLFVVGANGSGKSTLALAIAGVIPDFIEAEVSGSVSAGRPGLVLQDPSSQFFSMTVREELGPRAPELLKRFGSTGLLERSVFQLSEGEKQKVNLLANLSSSPSALLLDEPLELLDPFEAKRFREAIGRVRGLPLLWFDKSVPGIRFGRMVSLGNATKAVFPERKTALGAGVSLRADICIERESFSLNAFFSLARGEKAAIIGRNGSGKSMLLRAIAGIEKCSGLVWLEGPVSFAPQNPSHVFFNSTAEAEIASRENALLFGLGGLLGRSPSCLSRGQQKMLSLAGVRRRGIALLDEPTTWLDPVSRARVYNFISKSRQPMLIATHDRRLLDYCDSVYKIEGGELLECSSTAADRFFRG